VENLEKSIKKKKSLITFVKINVTQKSTKGGFLLCVILQELLERENRICNPIRKQHKKLCISCEFKEAPSLTCDKCRHHCSSFEHNNPYKKCRGNL